MNRDLTFNIEAIVGDFGMNNYEIVNLALDINSPWSWIKQDDCFLCPNTTPIPKFNEMLNDSVNIFSNCKKKCSKSKFTFNTTHLLTTSKRKDSKKAAIISDDSLLYGDMVED
jgi:hypothetical protein